MRTTIFCCLLAGTALRVAAAEFEIGDPRLEMALFAPEADIVSPLGAACDAQGRLFVIESHTHMRSKNYAGPESDRIKVFTDADHDGRAEKSEIFSDGFQEAMGLCFGPDASLYVVCADDVWRLDSEGGRAGERTKLLGLETKETYGHSKLLSIAFGPDGFLYAGRGNTGGHAWKLRGADGSEIQGYGDGGNIVRCRPDGTQVEEFATGFWNPFGLAFDADGRLIASDNDPDARGPNRIVHVVRGGDYGYQTLYGGSGNHPFQAWNGELPGTLPYISGTGEAPCGVLDTRLAMWPQDDPAALLVAVWSEHTIERHTTAPRGISLSAQRSVLVAGPENFRPVALAADPRGGIYITDWMQVDYPVHSHGRIWCLRAKEGIPLTAPRTMGKAVLAELTDGDALESALRSDDPLVHHQAVMRLSQSDLREKAMILRGNEDARLRLGALLALRRGGAPERESLVRQFLADTDPAVRLGALVWAGDEMLTALRADLDRAVSGENVSAALFEAWLAAVECLDEDYVRAFQQRQQPSAKQLTRHLPAGFIEQILGDKNQPLALRALAVARLEQPERHAELLMTLARSHDDRLQIESLRSLARAGGEGVPAFLVALAADAKLPASIRAEALTALQSQPPAEPAALLPLVQDPSAEVATAATWLLAASVSDPKIQAALRARHDTLPAATPMALREQLSVALGLPAERPTTPDEWQLALAVGGDAKSGVRIFFAARAICSTCHAAHGRGGTVGPDLGGIGASATREKIIHSILRPSDEFAPQWQAWVIETKGGGIHQGLQLHPKSGGAYDLMNPAGTFERFAAKDIARVYASKASLMPAGLEGLFTVSQFRDLVAFLTAH